VTTWLLAITRNLAIDRRRMRAARPADPTDPTSFVLDSGRPGPDELAVRSAETDRVRAALAGLPERQRRCVVLATIGGRSAREISEIEAVPLGTAKTRLRDGLRKLRLVLDEDKEAFRD
jgi:RNA polymerase sigma factor (sigma-70 family)